MRNVILLCGLLFPTVVLAQISGYVSATQGGSSNPLYDYAMVSDRTTEGYWELNYSDENEERTWEVGYVGGVMLFHDLAPRNYLEHRMVVKYQAGGFLLSGKFGARHDRPEFKVYDNLGLEATGGVTWGEEGETRTSLTDRFGFRSYTYLQELSNVSNELELSVKTGKATGFSFRSSLTFGVKHFTTNAIDTSALDVVNGQGNGNGQGKKQALLVVSSTANSFQIAGMVGLGMGWSDGGVEGELRYRVDPGSDTRFLTQVANATILGEDIYNDHFSYAGPELALMVRQTLPLDLRLGVSAGVQRKHYLVPAYDLLGVETDPDRVDLRGEVEGSLARSFSLGGDVSLDLTVSVSALRNQSNDTYNDFSVRSLGVSLGVGW